MQRLQARTRDVRIDLRGRQIAVTKQHLHGAQIGAMIEQMRCKRMPQGMRRDAGSDPGLPGMQLDPMSERLARHRIATPTRKFDVAQLIAEQQASRVATIALQPVHGFIAQRHQALLVALTKGA